MRASTRNRSWDPIQSSAAWWSWVARMSETWWTRSGGAAAIATARAPLAWLRMEPAGDLAHQRELHHLQRRALDVGAHVGDRVASFRRLGARVVVLAASALETARILLNSRTPRNPQGVANSSGTVGKYITDTTGTDVGGYIPAMENHVAHNEDGALEDVAQGAGVLGFAEGYDAARVRATSPPRGARPRRCRGPRAASGSTTPPPRTTTMC